MKPFWGVLMLLILVLVINVVFFVMPLLASWKSSFMPARVITVSAQGSATVTPDEALLNFSVVTQGQNPQTLSDNNNLKMAAVMQFISSQAIASSDVSTTGYNLQPNYQWDKNTNNQYITGYTLTQTVTVKVRDLTKVATILGGLAPLGVNQIGGVNFTFQDSNKFVALARADALTKAQTEASQMAAQAGASLGGVITVNESPNVPIPFYGGYAMDSKAMGAPQAATPPIAPGTQDVTDSVTVTYELKSLISTDAAP